MSLRVFSRLLLVTRGHRSIVLSPAASKRFYFHLRATQRLIERSFVSHTHGLVLQQRSYSSRSDGDAKPDASDSSSNSKETPDDGPPPGVWIVQFLTVASLLYLFYHFMDPKTEDNTVSWNEFYREMLAKGEVENIFIQRRSKYVVIQLVRGAVIKGKPTQRRMYFLQIQSIENFEQKLREAEKELGVKAGSVPVIYQRSGEIFSQILPIALLVGAFFIFRSMMKGNKTKSGLDWFSQMGRAKFTVVDHTIETSKPNVRFADVAGCHGAKQEVAEFVDYLQDSEKYKKLGAKYPKGVLLLGPPGCGKTMLAKAVAAEAQVPFLAMAGSEFVEVIGGLGAKRVRNLFQEARKRAPCIIYIDEIDAVGRNRGRESYTGGEGEHTLNQLLVEMDGIATKEGVIMLASTNRAEVLDSALLRPGRFDRHILIDLPNLAERIEIYEKHLASITLDQVPSRYSERLAQLTPGFSGADIANVVNEAALHAARLEKRCVTAEDLDYAVERVVGGIEKKTRAMSPEEKRRVAVHECGHAITSWFLSTTRDLYRISIVPRSSGALGMARYISSERTLLTTEELFALMCDSLGGQAAEVVVYGQATNGSENDLKHVTELAKWMVERYGMDSTIGPLYYDERKPFSKRLANLMDIRESRIVKEAFAKTVELLKEHRDELDALSEELFRKENLNRSDVEAICGPSLRQKTGSAPMIGFEIQSPGI